MGEAGIIRCGGNKNGYDLQSEEDLKEKLKSEICAIKKRIQELTEEMEAKQEAYRNLSAVIESLNGLKPYEQSNDNREEIEEKTDNVDKNKK